MYTICLSGPESSRAQAELALEDARVPIYPDAHHAVMAWERMFPEDSDAFVAVQHADIDHVARIVQAAGWGLRMHYPTPPEPEPSPLERLAATVDELRVALAELNARGGR